MRGLPEGPRLTDASRVAAVGRGALARRLERLVAVVAPVSIALVVGAVLASEQTGPSRELQLVAPVAARPGDRLALRANLLARVDEPDGPTLETAPVDVALRDARARTQARVRLAVSASRSMEGALRVPAGLAAGAYTLEAEARGVSVRAPLRVAPDAASAPSLPREAALLALLAEGPLLREPGVEESALPPISPLRVVGSACVPELPCRLLLEVGAPAVAVRLAATPSVEPRGEGAAPAVPPDVVALTAVVHGPEGETELQFFRGDTLLARRTLRLPVALGEVQLELVPRAHVGAPLTLQVRGAQRNRALIVDVFEDERWVFTRTFAGGALDTPRALPGFAFARTGPHRVQVRADLFDSEHAASRFVYVTPTASEPPPSLRANGTPPPADRAAAERRFAFEAALRDEARLPTPTPVSGREAAIARALARRARVRLVSAVALVALVGLLAVVLLRRGLEASREARALLREAGDTAAESAANRRRDTLTVVAVAALVAVVFLATLAFVLARLG